MQSLQTTIRITVKLLDSQGELFPLQSPLLGESWLVSFPLLINMLKFGRSSYLIWDPIGGWKRQEIIFLLNLPIETTALKRPLTTKSCEQHYHSGPNDAFNSIISQSPEFQEGESKRYCSPDPRVRRSTQKLTKTNAYWLSGVCGHSNKHTPGHIPEVQCAFKDLMIHEICNSHYVSHFAAFFIVVGAKTSVAESRMAFAS